MSRNVLFSVSIRAIVMGDEGLPQGVVMSSVSSMGSPSEYNPLPPRTAEKYTIHHQRARSDRAERARELTADQRRVVHELRVSHCASDPRKAMSVQD